MTILIDTLRDLRTPTEQQRVEAYEQRLRSLGDYNRHVHNARIRGGMAWQDRFRRRPIPRHRALVVAPAAPAPFPFVTDRLRTVATP